MPHSREKLRDDLKTLGVRPADTLFVHSSFKSLGTVDGRAASVVGALQDAIGPHGLLLMPSFNLVEHERRAATWNIDHTPSTVGWLTEFFRLLPDTHRSDHYSHSVAARGSAAAEFVADHLRREGYRSPWDCDPWGRTYGTHSPMYRAYRANGKLLMLGVDYNTSTYIHLVEVMHWNRRLEENPDTPHRAIDRPSMGAFWDANADLRRGPVGDAACRLFSIRPYVDTLLAEVEGNPDPYLK